MSPIETFLDFDSNGELFAMSAMNYKTPDPAQKKINVISNGKENFLPIESEDSGNSHTESDNNNSKSEGPENFESKEENFETPKALKKVVQADNNFIKVTESDSTKDDDVIQAGPPQ